MGFIPHVSVIAYFSLKYYYYEENNKCEICFLCNCINPKDLSNDQNTKQCLGFQMGN